MAHNEMCSLMMSSEALRDRQWFTEALASDQVVAALKNIDTILCDVDGTLTDGSIYVTSEVEEGRNFSILDGYLVSFLQQAGVRLILISGKSHASTLVRARALNVDLHDCIVGRCDKVTWLKEKLDAGELQTERLLLFGDDLVDLHVALQKQVALYATPANAPFYIQSCADLVVPRDGGQHAFRLLVDLLLYVQGKHPVQSVIQRALVCKQQG